MWLIRAIINGNIIIQASISKRSHLNEYIFCLGAGAASEPLKRKEKEKKKNRRSHWCKALEDGAERTQYWELGIQGPGHCLRSDPSVHSLTLGKTLCPTCEARGTE